MRSNFSDILSQSEILDSPAELEHYGRDWCKEYSAAPSLILLPKSQSQVSTILQRCNERRIPIVPSGGRTGLSGGATATQDEVIVSTERLNKIIEINPLDFTARCEAGVVTQQLQTAASDHGLCYPISFASAGSSHIGGNIATNAGGVKVIRYGSTRDWVLGLRVCLASGEVLELNGSLYKNQTGYNLLSLFVGSEGTLGIITEATLKLCAPPRNLMRFMAGTKSIAKSLQILKKLRTSSYQVSMFEYMASNGMLQVLQHTALTDPFPNHYPAYLLVELEDIDREAQDQLELFLSGCIECCLLYTSDAADDP